MFKKAIPYAVVIVDTPQDEQSLRQGAWPAFLLKVEKFGSASGKSPRPSTNVWTIPLDSGTGILAGVASLAQEYGIAHRVLHFREAPIEYSFESPNY